MSDWRFQPAEFSLTLAGGVVPYPLERSHFVYKKKQFCSPQIFLEHVSLQQLFTKKVDINVNVFHKQDKQSNM